MHLESISLFNYKNFSDVNFEFDSKINYFVKMNPNWHQGDELCCIAKVSLTVPIRYFFKQVKKTIQKKLSL